MTAHMTPLVHVMAQLVTPAPGHRHIFAFDLLMRKDRIQEDCPSAMLVSTARLLSRRWIVNEDGVATIMPCRGSVVHGVIWQITETEQVALETQLRFPSMVERVGAFARGPHEEMMTTELYASRNHRHGAANWRDIIQLMDTGHALNFPEEYLNDVSLWGPRPVEYEGPRLVQ